MLVHGIGILLNPKAVSHGVVFYFPLTFTPPIQQFAPLISSVIAIILGQFLIISCLDL